MELEQIIESFKDQLVQVDGIGNEAGSQQERVEVRDLRDGEISRGQCDGVSSDFNKFAASCGLGAEFEEFSSPSHTASLVETEEGEFIVDFTATQFGGLFPMIAKKREEELDDEELDKLEEEGYSDTSFHDPYMSFDFIAVYKPL